MVLNLIKQTNKQKIIDKKQKTKNYLIVKIT